MSEIIFVIKKYLRQESIDDVVVYLILIKVLVYKVMVINDYIGSCFYYLF